MLYSTIERNVIFNTCADRKGVPFGEIPMRTDRGVNVGCTDPPQDLYCETGSPAFTTKWVPRMPMVAVGVSKRALSGASFPMRPER